MGQGESMQYDAGGNLLFHTDFNGNTTGYQYDSMNRLLSKTPAASLSEPAIGYTYTASGQRNTMSDASGGKGVRRQFLTKLNSWGRKNVFESIATCVFVKTGLRKLLRWARF